MPPHTLGSTLRQSVAMVSGHWEAWPAGDSNWERPRQQTLSGDDAEAEAWRDHKGTTDENQAQKENLVLLELGGGGTLQ